VKTETIESLPPRRLVSRYSVGHHRTIDSFLAALRRRLEAMGQ
jgi:hypothetical protein